MHQPGERWLYHTGSDVLGVLIARASGQPLETFLRERIFEPLGMKDTGFSVPAAKLDRLRHQLHDAIPQTEGARLLRRRRRQPLEPAAAFPSGGGGLVSTVDDYLAFGQMLLNKGKHGGERILSRPSVELMTTDQLTPEQKRAPGCSSAMARAGASASPSSRGATTSSRRPAASAGTAASAPRPSRPGRGHGRHPDDPALMDSPVPPRVFRDFWTSVYQAIDD